MEVFYFFVKFVFGSEMMLRAHCVHRWTCIGWPHKIQKQMEVTETTLEADEERFQKNLLGDQNTFQDRLDSLNMAVAGFAAHTDLSKSHEVANEVRRLTKQLKECQNLATTYNNRERLFGMPVTSVRRSLLLLLLLLLLKCPPISISLIASLPSFLL